MPQVNGFEATRKIRAGFPDTRVIIVTIHDSDHYRAAVAAAGAECFISKLHLGDELPGAIAQLFPGPGEGAFRRAG